MGEAARTRRQGIHAKPVYLPLRFSVNLKLLFKINLFTQKTNLQLPKGKGEWGRDKLGV